MRRILITYTIYICTILSVEAQLAPLYNQYHMNGLAINPAFAGSDEALSITLLHRNQWVGFEGAPMTSTLAVHSPLNRESIAVGFLLMHDQIGISKNTLFTGSYAYRIISHRGIFSLGLGAGLRLQNEAIQELRKIDFDDEYFPSTARTYLLPDFNIGIYYKTDNYYAGFSMVSILGSRFNSGTGKYKIALNLKETNYMIQGGFFATLRDGIRFNPETLIKYNLINAFQVDLNLNVILKERFWIGTGYRSRNGMIWLVQFMANPQIRIAYSYGMDFSALGRYNKGSHEIMVKYVFNYLIEAVNPRQF
jgi:type IX secretion system PorP/SprF family membrane protein